MPKPTTVLLILSLFVLFFSTDFGCSMELSSGTKYTWCIAHPSATNAALKANLDYACRKVNCSLIQQGGSCFFPNTYEHHASFAMNLYYQFMGRHLLDCEFGNTSLISLSNPSLRTCTYETGGALVDSQPLTKTWCVANPTTPDEALMENLDFACNHVDCSPIQEGGSCFNPSTLTNHAAFAMNLYYQKNGRNYSSCDFMNSGIIVAKDPSYGDCIYEHL